MRDAIHNLVRAHVTPGWWQDELIAADLDLVSEIAESRWALRLLRTKMIGDIDWADVTLRDKEVQILGAEAGADPI